MIDISDIPPDNLRATMRLIQAQLQQRGWHGELPHAASPHIFLDRGDGKKLHIYSSTPPTTSFASAQLVNDKYATYHALVAAGIAQLDTAYVDDKSGLEPGINMLQKAGKVVVKPVDGGHGRGIRINITTPEELEQAVSYARQFTNSIDGVVVQQQFTHDTTYDIRILCINGAFVAAIHRVAARVTGDGERTLKELIQRENQQSYRGEPYKAKLTRIDENRAAEYLKERIDTVPKAGEQVTVLGIANYGAGGELVDVTDAIPDWMKQDAATISQQLGLPVAGIDFMTAALPTPDVAREQLPHTVLEVNKCPSLCIHDEPTEGQNRGVTSLYMDYLATL